MTDITAKLAAALGQASFCLRTLVPDDTDAKLTVSMIESALSDYRQHTEAQAGGTEGALSLSEWLAEREANCRRLAANKTGEERAGWLEDANYFMSARAALASAPAAAQGEPKPDPSEAYRATVAMLLEHAKPAKNVSHEEVLEIAAMSSDDLRRRAVVARDWHRLFSRCLDGLPALLTLGAPPDGCWFPKDIRRVVESLLSKTEAAHEAGRQLGMSQANALWEMAKAEQAVPVANRCPTPELCASPIGCTGECIATPPATERRPLTEADTEDLERLEGLFNDDEGWDLPKERMQRLAELGAIRRTSGNHYAITAFGMSCLHPEQWGMPLKTAAEWNEVMRLKSLGITAGTTEQAKEKKT